MGKSTLVKRDAPEDPAAVVILCDLSGSMRGEPVNRLREHLAQMWAEVEMFTELWGFNEKAFLVDCPEKLPVPCHGTMLADAFRQIARRWPSRVILISDGLPDNEAEAETEASRLPGTIDAIFVGPETDDRGIAFMRRLTTANGGQTVVRDLHTSKAILAPAIREMLSLPAPIEL